MNDELIMVSYSMWSWPVLELRLVKLVWEAFHKLRLKSGPCSYTPTDGQVRRHTLHCPASSDWS